MTSIPFNFSNTGSKIIFDQLTFNIMKINHPLMHNNFSNSDIREVKKLLKIKYHSDSI